MTEKTIHIEVDGKTLEAEPGQMLIEVTDANDIYIPRFCYHKKLSIAANCRMCLVDVEKAPKALPACATPVMDGMKVKTQSRAAVDAQKSVMEFLLINHPLDCPICDQGGECELQDLAMGYGQDVSRYSETKRVVNDKNIGPLVQTDMTRCIHCTRCVRFGEEIAGMRELGATGRGEHMQIGTYIEKAMNSELSGNVIDVCPVGALTSKPFRFSARSWELQQKPGIAAHDCVGSNIYYHVKQDRIKRVVPREIDAVNENWISDRDRYSYEGLYHEDRLLHPMIKTDGVWKTVSWDQVISFIVQGLGSIRQDTGSDSIAGLLHSSATLEEAYLFQKLIRGLGSNNIDYRLQQTDFRLQNEMPLFPWLGQTLQDLESTDCVLYLLGNLRQQQPMLNHRIRKAVLKGAKIFMLDTEKHDYNYSVTEQRTVKPEDIAREMKAICLALSEKQSVTLDAHQLDLMNDARVEEIHHRIATHLLESNQATIMIGSLVERHPDASMIIYLGRMVAELSRHKFSIISSGANTAGICLAGALPHRGPHGDTISSQGKHAGEILDSSPSACLLLGIELDQSNVMHKAFMNSLERSELVVQMSGYVTEQMQTYANVLLPIAMPGENEGTFINIQGDSQTFTAAVKPVAESVQCWRILRQLGHELELDGFEYNDCDSVRKEVMPELVRIRPSMPLPRDIGVLLDYANVDDMSLQEVHMYCVDPVVRRASALQQVYQQQSNLEE